MFKHVNFSWPIGLGFGAALLALAGLGILAHDSQTTAARNFTNYYALAQDQSLAGELEASTLRLRLLGKEVGTSANLEGARGYEAEKAHFLALLARARQQIGEPKPAALLKLLDERFQAYDAQFAWLIHLAQKGDSGENQAETLKLLERAGPALAKASGELRAQINAAQDKSAASLRGSMERKIALWLWISFGLLATGIVLGEMITLSLWLPAVKAALQAKRAQKTPAATDAGQVPGNILSSANQTHGIPGEGRGPLLPSPELGALNEVDGAKAEASQNLVPFNGLILRRGLWLGSFPDHGGFQNS